MVKGVIWEANAFEFRWQDSPHIMPKRGAPTDSGSITNSCPRFPVFKSHLVYICRAKSTNVAGQKFFLGLQALFCRRFLTVFDGL